MLKVHKKLTYIIWVFMMIAALSTIRDACNFIYQNYVKTNKSMVTDYVTIDSFDNMYIYFKNHLGETTESLYKGAVNFKVGDNIKVYNVDKKCYYTNKKSLFFNEVNWKIHAFIICVSILVIIRSIVGIYKCWKENKIICILKEI